MFRPIPAIALVISRFAKNHHDKGGGTMTATATTTIASGRAGLAISLACSAAESRAAVRVQYDTQRTEGVTVRPVVDVHAAAFGFNEPGPAKLA